MGKLIRNGIEYGGGNGTDIFEVTQAEYDALVQAGTLVHNALYVITDAPNLNETAKDISYDGGADTVWNKVESLKTASVTITENSGYTVSRITSGINGKLVGVTAVIDGTYTVNSWADVGTIDKKPSADALAPFVNPQNGAFSGMVNITSAGLVRVYATVATTRCGFTIAYATT